MGCKIRYDNLDSGHISQECHVSMVRCKFCNSKNVVKYGFQNHIQQYLCRDCGRKFNENDTLDRMRTPTAEIGAALSMFYDGLSLAAISRQLEGIFHDFVNPSTIYRWIMQYSQEAIKLLESYKANVSTTWVVDETVISIVGKNHWYWDVLCEKSRFLIGTHLSMARTTNDVVTLFSKCSKHTDVIPRFIISDKLPAYIGGIEKVFGADTKHIKSQGMSSDINTNLIERFHSTLKQRTKVMRDMKTTDTAQIILDGFVIHYNFFRHHMTLGDVTPAEVAGIKLPFDTWEGLLRFL